MIKTVKIRDEIFINSDHHLIEITANASLLLLLEQPKKKVKRIPVRKLK